MEYFFIIYPQHQKNQCGWMLTKHSKFQWQHNYLFKKINYIIFDYNTQEQLFEII